MQKTLKNFQDFSKYLNEIGFSNLKDKYSIVCCDCDTKEVTIFYGNNAKKTIYDYGENASLNLVRFYDKVDDFIKKSEMGKEITSSNTLKTSTLASLAPKIFPIFTLSNFKLIQIS